MGKIIYCSDLVLRVDNHEEIHNITEWLMASTEFRPAYPDGCVVRNEMSTMGKLGVILIVWMALIILTTFYCYFCERRLFPAMTQKVLDEAQSDNYSIDDSTSSSSVVQGFEGLSLSSETSTSSGGSGYCTGDTIPRDCKKNTFFASSKNVYKRFWRQQRGGQTSRQNLLSSTSSDDDIIQSPDKLSFNHHHPSSILYK